MITNRIAHIAALVGEPARTAMLLELMDGRALTALELARAGGVSAQTASRHLSQLVQAALLQVEQLGRHRYHRLASAEVAHMLEGIMQIAGQSLPRRAVQSGPRETSMRMARMCYDHIAGRLGLAIAERLQQQGAIVLEGGAGHVTERGHEVLQRWGLALPDPATAPAGRRPWCRPCLDWSERKSHIAGRLGALLCSHSLEQGWLTRKPSARVLAISPHGAQALRRLLGLQAWNQVTDGA